MNSQSSVPLTKLAERMRLHNLTPDVDLTGRMITKSEINRPALQLTGYFDYFDAERIQIIGYVEYTYLEHLTREQKLPIYRKLLSYQIPCLVYTTRTHPEQDLLDLVHLDHLFLHIVAKNLYL